MHPVDPPRIFHQRSKDGPSRPGARPKTRRALELDLHRSIGPEHRVTGGPNLIERNRSKVHAQAMNEPGQESVPFFERARSEAEALRLHRVETAASSGFQNVLTAGDTQEFPDLLVFSPQDRIEKSARCCHSVGRHGRSQPISSRMSRTRIR